MLIAEPVGSCTDLLVTVVPPLQVLYSNMFKIAPLTIMVDAISVLDEGFDRHSVDGYLRAHQLEEAELGWYNGTMALNFGQGTDSYDLDKKIMEGFSARYPKGNIAHAKIMLSPESNALRMSSVRGMVSIDAANGSRISEGKGKLTINARVISDPEMLRNNIRTMLKEVLGVDVLSFDSEDSFVPSPPRPFHRMVD